MSNKKKAYELYEAGFNCPQIVATLCSNKCGNDEKTGRAAMGAFASGMNCGEVCGAVSGGLYSLGVYCNHCEYNDTETMEKITDMSKEFTSIFKETFGSLRCNELAPDMDITRCGEYIMKSVDLVNEIIERDKTNEI